MEKEASKLVNRLSKSHFSHRDEDIRRLREWTKDAETYERSKGEILSLLWTVLS